MNSQKEFEEWYVLEVSGCNGEYVEKLASGEYYDRDTNKAWQAWQAAKESCATEIAALKAECEHDQRNAAQSQRETLQVLKENKDLKARIAIPSGYQLAPVEPTLDMLKAAYDHRESDEYTGVEDIYKVMLQAAKEIKL